MSNVIVMNNSYADENALHDVFDYCLRSAIYCHGYGVRMVSKESVIESMEYIKKYHGKTGGKQLCHIIIGVDTIFDTGMSYTKKQTAIDGAELDKFTRSLSEYIYYKYGYQNCCFRHISKKGRPHAHFIINPVHVQTGKKLASHSNLAYEIHEILNFNFPKLKWGGVKYDTGDYDEW